MFDFHLVESLRSNELTLPEYLAQMEARFDEREPSVHSFILEKDRFTRLHEDANALVSQYPGLVDRPLLFGTMVGVKDIFHVNGFLTQAGSRLPVDELQGTEAESVTRLKNAGALVLGKTVTTEFAYFFPGPTRNPHNLEHTPGGSSSGSAAAVALGLCHLALGTQTIGSIIRPASFCGVVGMKPTYDRVSREGVIPLSPSLDHVGFFAPDVEAAIHAARALYEDWDEPNLPLRKPTLGFPRGVYMESVPEEGRVHFEKVCERIGTLYDLQNISIMPDFQEVRDHHDVIMSVEASQVHADWFEKYEKLYSPRFIELIHRGQSFDDSQYQDAITARDEFRSEMRRSMIDHNIDLWICPSALGAAPKGLESTGDPIMNLPWTQAGLPAVNLPAGKNQDGLPLGLQLIGNWHKDESLLFWAKELEKDLSEV